MFRNQNRLHLYKRIEDVHVCYYIRNVHNTPAQLRHAQAHTVQIYIHNIIFMAILRNSQSVNNNILTNVFWLLQLRLIGKCIVETRVPVANSHIQLSRFRTNIHVYNYTCM